MLRLADIATVRRGFSDPPQPLFRVNGTPAIGLAIAMRDGGDILTLGENVTAAVEKAKAELPLGIEPILVSDQAVTVEVAVSEFMSSLWQAVGIILAVSFISLGVRPGLVIAMAIPLTLAIVFIVMDLAGIDMQRISLGALIIALCIQKRLLLALAQVRPSPLRPARLRTPALPAHIHCDPRHPMFQRRSLCLPSWQSLKHPHKHLLLQILPLLHLRPMPPNDPANPRMQLLHYPPRRRFITIRHPGMNMLEECGWHKQSIT
jgi:hypothetical protein